MEAVSFSETSVNVYQTTRRNIPDDSHLQTNSKPHEGHRVFENSALLRGVQISSREDWAILAGKVTCRVSMQRPRPPVGRYDVP
jgi:hypothetical protein